MMNVKPRLWAAAAVAGAALLTSGIGPASAQTAYDYNGRPVYGAPSRPLTVQRRYAPRPRIVAPIYNPYDGPQTVITAPLAAASTLVALPFRVINGVFPPYGNPGQDPRVLVGAPVHAAGQIAQLPFRAMQAPFGGWDYQPYELDYPAY